MKLESKVVYTVFKNLVWSQGDCISVSFLNSLIG